LPLFLTFPAHSLESFDFGPRCRSFSRCYALSFSQFYIAHCWLLESRASVLFHLPSFCPLILFFTHVFCQACGDFETFPLFPTKHSLARIETTPLSGSAGFSGLPPIALLFPSFGVSSFPVIGSPLARLARNRDPPMFKERLPFPR